MNKREFIPRELPPNFTPDSEVYSLLSIASRKLGELNGFAKIIPNQEILINSLILQEAKDSAAIENIITTHAELFLAQADEKHLTQNAKEVQDYALALRQGFEGIKREGLLLNRHILEIQRGLEKNNAGFRTQGGTLLKNPKTGEVKHIPPQNPEEIKRLMSNLEKYINEDQDSLDPLIRLAMIHYQFESIHPFYDGNGRSGRILNVLYLTHKKLLDLPILYLSAYIIKYKEDYYRLLAEVSKSGDFKDWVVYMLRGIEQTSVATIQRIGEIHKAMQEYTQTLQEKASRIYSRDLVELLFSYPYTKIESLESKLGIHRQTASNYLKECESLGLLEILKMGRNKYFVNTRLFDILRRELLQ